MVAKDTTSFPLAPALQWIKLLPLFVRLLLLTMSKTDHQNKCLFWVTFQTQSVETVTLK